ncbi:MAG: hypothetical protein HZA89_11730 [Verrucomicrobia bacterium]|nr:hypothetical protein [Verrucomicrobiota bacterium]
MLRFSKLLLVAALAISIGLHWALLQSVAWVGMVVNYAQSAPLGEALAKTFDGQHPCKLCKLVKDGQHAEKKQEAQKTEIKFEVFLSVSCVTLYPPSFAPLPAALATAMSARSESPPLPPPRLLPG